MHSTAVPEGPAKRLGLPNRRLHLIDIENLLGTGDFSRGEAKAAFNLYTRIVPVGPHDLTTVASSHRVALRTIDWDGARRLVRSGIDGADRRLLEVIETEELATRFAGVVIASGDGIFAEAAAALQSQGCGVTVVARPGSLSRRLAFAVRDRIVFVDTAMPCTAALGRAA